MAGSPPRVPLDLRVRPEQPKDREGVHRVVAEAFGSEAEAELVEALRAQTEPFLSWVAELWDGRIVGHIAFTPVRIEPAPAAARAFGLAPLAVHPSLQGRGAGSVLVEAGLAACRREQAARVFVLGSPDYYARFGFREAWELGFYYQQPGHNPAFRVCELEVGAPRCRGGAVVYAPAFDAL